jgi:hypothetical protein
MGGLSHSGPELISTVGNGPDRKPKGDAMDAKEFKRLIDFLNSDVPDSGIPLTAFDLSVLSGRVEFLERFMELGADAAFEATAHVWTMLDEPKDARCTLMGIRAGTGGTGKAALYKVLVRFTEDWLGDFGGVALPVAPSLAEFHGQAMAAWKAEADRERRVVDRYAAILNGN